MGRPPEPTFARGVQQSAEQGSTPQAAVVAAAVRQDAAQEDDPYSRMGIFLVAGGRFVCLCIETLSGRQWWHRR